jgi:ribosomal protein S18 acetylase RimI-like enzyme
MSAVQKGEVNIRPMERKDIFPVLSMFKKMPDARGVLTHRDLVGWSLGQEGDASFVAEIDGQIAGLLLARFTFLGIPVARVCSIQVIVVDPDYLRRRIGVRLVEAVLDRCYAEGVDTVRAFVPERNWELKDFLKTLDFKPSGIIEYVRTVQV